MTNNYRLFAIISMAFLFTVNITAQQAGFKTANHYFKMPAVDASEYAPNTVVFKVKPQFRSSCTVNSIENQVKLNEFLSSIGAYNLTKIFPRHTAPEKDVNDLGQKYADLSLIYSFSYMANVSLENVLNKLFTYGIFEYVELKVIPKTCAAPYTPNDPNISGNQYSITQLRADSAWGINTTTARGDTNVVIGITDTGIDFAHVDLGNVKYNYLDPINGADDDGDGYIDNFRGWDLGSNDNNPTWQGSNHGVHVSGIAAAKTDNSVGMAGIGFNCKYLPIKIANSSGQLIAAYEGITYAADHGCKIINCSWGGSIYTNLGQDVVTYATINKDALVIAAAGNAASQLLFYPATYKYVINIGGIRDNHQRWSGSNFGYHLDVSVGGHQVYGTVNGNTYQKWDGTSMASPNAAGAAGLIRAFYPHYTALQAGEQLRSTSDSARLYSANTNIAYRDKLGKGVVNLYRALSDSTIPGIVMTNRTETDNNDDSFVIGDTINITGTFTNYLAPTTNLQATLSVVTGGTHVSIIDGSTTLGVINKLANKDNSADPFKVRILGSAPLNTVITFKVTMKDGNYTTIEFFDITVNVDYINIAINDVATTITSKGLIGYNADNQQQGLGFKYKNSGSVLYDAALMIGTDSASVSDAARSTTTTPDADFVPVVRVRKVSNTYSDFDLDGTHNDNAAASPLDVLVHHNAYAWTSPGHTKYVMLKYVITNNGTGTLNNLYAGIFADWDIDASTYENNRAAYDATNKMGYVYHTAPGGIYCGIKVLSNTAPAINYAFDNIAGGAGGIDIANGYSGFDKYTSLSTNRLSAGTTGQGEDVMHTVSTGPFTIAAGDSIIIGFALIAGDSLADLQTSAQGAQVKWDGIMGVSVEELKQNVFYNVKNYPNPSNGQTTIDFTIAEKSNVVLSIYNVVGQQTKTTNMGQLTNGRHIYNLNAEELTPGIYYYQLKAGEKTYIGKMIISK